MSHSFTEALQGGNFAIGKAGLAAGTTSTFSVAAFAYSIEGQIYNKAAASNVATPTTDENLGKAFLPVNRGQACNFVFAVNRAGTVKVYQGPITPAGELTDWPPVPFDHAVFGNLRVESAASNGVPFVLGASNMTGLTGVTYSFKDITGMAARPIAA